jgi:hypothetical protein
LFAGKLLYFFVNNIPIFKADHKDPAGLAL